MGPPRPGASPDSGPSRWLPALALVVLALVAYGPAYTAGFVWDDDAVTENPLLRDWSGLAGIWSPAVAAERIPHEEHYWPLTYTSFWLEARLWGLGAATLHATNVALHALNGLLLWRLLRRLRAPGAWFAAAWFAVHPVHVESVAWIIERKDVLSGACYLGAALAFVRFDQGGPRRARTRDYGIALALFACALLSKSIAVSLPLALGAYLWVAHGRLTRGHWLQLLPFASVALLAAGFELRHAGLTSMPLEVALSLGERVELAGNALLFYARQALLPLDLAPIHGAEIPGPGSWFGALAVAGVLLGLGLGYARGRLARAPVAAVLLYMATLAPVLGFVDFSFMRHSYVADRFQYLASAWLLALVAGGLSVASARLERRWVGGLAALGLLVLALQTWHLSTKYADAETLARFMVERNPAAWTGHSLLADELTRRGELELARHHYERALAEREWAGGHIGLATVALQAGDLNAAVEESRRAVALDPSSYKAQHNLGLLLDKLGRSAQAQPFLERALELRPDSVEALCDLGVCLSKQGSYEPAIRRFSEALALDPAHARARQNLETAARLQREEAR